MIVYLDAIHRLARDHSNVKRKLPNWESFEQLDLPRLAGRGRPQATDPESPRADEFAYELYRCLRIFLHDPVTRRGNDRAGNVVSNKAQLIGHCRAKDFSPPTARTGMEILPQEAGRAWMTKL
jgi:hypothetical protein